MPEKPENRKRGGKRFLIASGLFLLCLTSAYGYGRWQGARAAAGVQAAAAGERESAAARVSHARSELTDLRAQVQMLQARRRLDLALTALDERNFGTAAAALHAAGADLAAGEPPAGADGAVLVRLAQELQSARLEVGEDFSRQRGRILGWIRELDAQFPAEPATAAAAGATDSSAPGAGAASPVPPGAEASTAPATPAAAPGGSQ